jgi:hypothetical protein
MTIQLTGVFHFPDISTTERLQKTLKIPAYAFFIASNTYQNKYIYMYISVYI